MTLSEVDWSVLRGSAILLVASLVVGGGALAVSH